MNPSELTTQAAFLAALRVRPKLTFPEWAHRHIRSNEGPFRLRPYQVAPAASIFNPEIYSTSLRMYSGAGKTYLFAPAMVYAIAQLNLEIATQFPTMTQAEEWLRNKLRPFLDNTPAIRDLEKPQRDVASGIRWHNGAAVLVSGANSGGTTRTLEVHWTNAEEIDAIVQDGSDEGDKLLNFERRSRGRAIQIHTRSAYPSIKGRSKIDAALDASDGCEWHFECPKCGESPYWHPTHIKHPEGQPEEAEVECPLCSGLFSDTERHHSSLETGHWINRDGERVDDTSIPSEKYGRNRGFHLNCMAHVGAHDPSRRNYMHEVAAAGEDAKRAPDPEKAKRAVINTLWSESYELEFESKASRHALLHRREKYSPLEMLPDGVLMITGGGDVNKRFLSATLKGWGHNGESWALDYADIAGHVDDPDTWKQYWAWIHREWKHPLGVSIRCARFFLDTRYQKSISRRETKKHGRNIARAITGSNTLGAPIIHTRKLDRESGLTVQAIGTHEAKDLIQHRLQLDPPGDGESYPENYMHYPESQQFASLYFEQLTESEESYLKQSPSDGEFYPFYRKTEASESGSLRNEPLDCEVYALAAKHSLNPNFAAVESMLRKRAEAEKPATKPTKPKRKRAGWVGGFSK